MGAESSDRTASKSIGGTGAGEGVGRESCRRSPSPFIEWLRLGSRINLLDVNGAVRGVQGSGYDYVLALILFC